MPYSSSSESTVETEKIQSDSPYQNPMKVSATDSPFQPQKPTGAGLGWLSVILAIALALGAGFFGGQWWQANQKTVDNSTDEQSEKPRGTNVRTATVETKTLQEKTEFAGTLEAKQAVNVQPEIDGRITEIFVQSGDLVQQGDAIARLKSDNIETQIRQAQANLAQTRARLAELQAGSRPEEIAQGRARVAEAQARLRDAESGSLLAEINQAQAEIDANQAEAQLAARRAERFQELNQSGAISRDEYDALVAQQETAQANLRSAQRRLQQLQENRQSEIQLRRAVVEQEQQALRQLQNGTRQEEIAQAEAEVAAAVAQVRNYEVQLQETAVLAPFTGAVGDVTAKVGDFVSSGDTLTTLTENQSLDLRLPIPQERKGDLRIGLPVQMFDAQGKSLGTGRVSFISPQINQESQTVLAKATIDNSEGLLKDGQFVRAQVIWKEKPNTVVVPMTAVKFQGSERFVFVVNEGESPTAKRQPIKLGLIQNEQGEVLEGLKPGQKLIISGTQKLSDGGAINIMEGNRQPERGGQKSEGI